MKSKSKLVNSARQKDVFTDNGAITNSTSLNSILDLFFIAGACRSLDEKKIEVLLTTSWHEDSLLTTKLIFWAGDIRGGAGERRFFRIALKWLFNTHIKTFLKNYKLVPEFNRWDSLFEFQTEDIASFIYNSLKKEKNGLLAKWMPRKKQYDNFADYFRKTLGLAPKEYRKLIVKLSETVEQQMCEKEWTKINYEHVPSVAFHKYRKAFARNDKERFVDFLGEVEKGEKKINASAIFPHQIITPVLLGSVHADRAVEKSIDLQWSQLPDYLKDSDERMLPVCDVSGSMSCMNSLPLSISVALGIYLSERNRSIFKDAFVTFSGSPKMEYLKGTLIERVRQLQQAHWDGNTDLSAVFKLILNRAKADSLKQKDMPSTILIISDMEFDSCASLTNYENIVKNYAEAGYKVPQIVFWNVNGRDGNVPVSYKQKGVALVSGSSPSIVKAVLSGELSPMKVVLDVLNNKRYDVIKA